VLCACTSLILATSGLHAAVPGDTAATAIGIAALPFMAAGDSSAFNDDYDENCPYVAPGAPDVVYSFTPAASVVVDIDLCNSAYDTKVYVYAGTAPPPGSGPTGLSIACNDDSGCGPNGWASHIANLSFVGGTTYWIVVDGFGGSPAGESGPYTLAITGAPPPALDIGTEKQLFLDERFTAFASGVTLTTNLPSSIQENLMTASGGWEAGWTGGYSTVIQEGDTVHMWYEPADAGYQTRVAYARSDDRGASWTRPALGLVPFQGSTANNLVLDGVHGTHVFRNRPGAPAAQRYGLFVGSQNRLFVSPDGLAWTPFGPQPFLSNGGLLDSQNVMFFDPPAGSYVAFPRMNVGGAQTRRVGRTLTTDLASGFATAPLVVLSPDALDPPDVDFYTSAAIRYPWAADAFLAFPALFHHLADTLDIGFAASRDGSAWNRPTHAALIALAPGSRSLYAGQGLTRDGDKIALYFTRYHAPHSGPYVFDGGIGRAIWRLDGFTSMDAGATPGVFRTPPLTFSGTQLLLNLACGPGGAVRVEVQDSGGRVLPRFAAARCVPVTGDSTATVVRWSGDPALAALAGTPVVLRFEMRKAKLYAFQFPGPGQGR
jgi:hypothetical protein